MEIQQQAFQKVQNIAKLSHTKPAQLGMTLVLFVCVWSASAVLLAVLYPKPDGSVVATRLQEEINRRVDEANASLEQRINQFSDEENAQLEKLIMELDALRENRRSARILLNNARDDQNRILTMESDLLSELAKLQAELTDLRQKQKEKSPERDQFVSPPDETAENIENLIQQKEMEIDDLSANLEQINESQAELKKRMDVLSRNYADIVEYIDARQVAYSNMLGLDDSRRRNIIRIKPNFLWVGYYQLTVKYDEQEKRYVGPLLSPDLSEDTDFSSTRDVPLTVLSGASLIIALGLFYILFIVTKDKPDDISVDFTVFGSSIRLLHDTRERAYKDAQTIHATSMILLVFGVTVAFMGVAFFFLALERTQKISANGGIDKPLDQLAIIQEILVHHNLTDRVTHMAVDGNLEGTFVRGFALDNDNSLDTGQIIEIIDKVSNFDGSKGRARKWYDTFDVGNYLKATGVLFFIEAIAFFLLRQYRRSMDDYKDLQKRAFARGNLLAASLFVDECRDRNEHTFWSRQQQDELELRLFDKILAEDFSVKLTNGQSTEAIEAAKIKDENAVFSALSRFFTRNNAPANG